jgi:Phage terminase large subunit (GpA)
LTSPTIRSGFRSRHQAGVCLFPIGYQHEFFNQLTSEQVCTRFVRGHPVRYWFKPSGKRNKTLDRRVYALAALHARPVPWEVLLRAARTEPPPRPPSLLEGGDPHARLPASPLPGQPLRAAAYTFQDEMKTLTLIVMKATRCSIQSGPNVAFLITDLGASPDANLLPGCIKMATPSALSFTKRVIAFTNLPLFREVL